MNGMHPGAPHGLILPRAHIARREHIGMRQTPMHGINGHKPACIQFDSSALQPARCNRAVGRNDSIERDQPAIIKHHALTMTGCTVR